MPIRRLTLSSDAQKDLRKLGQRIRQLRRKQRISIREMAEKMQVSSPTFIDLEKGSPSVGMGTWIKAVEVLNGRCNLLSLLETAEPEEGKG